MDYYTSALASRLGRTAYSISTSLLVFLIPYTILNKQYACCKLSVPMLQKDHISWDLVSSSIISYVSFCYSCIIYDMKIPASR